MVAELILFNFKATSSDTLSSPRSLNLSSSTSGMGLSLCPQGQSKISLTLARAAGIVAIDAPYVTFRDTEGFEKDTLYGRQLGFEGRLLIHPSQIEPSHRIYTPAPERVEWAREVVKVFEEEGIAKGSAAVSYKGKMVDTPVYLGAKQILETMAEIEVRERKRSGK